MALDEPLASLPWQVIFETTVRFFMKFEMENCDSELIIMFYDIMLIFTFWIFQIHLKNQKKIISFS